jgi:hypothetical protein
MMLRSFGELPEVAEQEWVTLPGGELEAARQRRLCPACRAALACADPEELDVRRAGTLCFECHRIEARRQAALKAAGEVFTGSAERLQTGLPFEPVDRARLARLRAERVSAQASASRGTGRFADRRRHAQIGARRALGLLAAGLRAHRAMPAERSRVLAAAARAAELQLPDSWLPFVVGR